jgi:hypothetical protein
MWTPEERAYERGKSDAYVHVLKMIDEGCSNQCGEVCLTMTDCCEGPRWGCETRVQNGDVTVCHWRAGCSPDA